MYQITQDGKYQGETISWVLSFADVLGTASIGATPVITITVIAGYDPTPADMLYALAYTADTVTVTLTKGVIGCIYNVETSVVDGDGHTYVKESYLAILPEAGTASGQIIPFYFTSWPYPIEYSEGLTSSISPQAGTILLNPRWTEGLTSLISLQAASLTLSRITYNNYIPEGLTSSITPESGALTLGRIVYSNYIPEGLVSSILPYTASMLQGRVVYLIPSEGLTSSITPIAGTLS